MDTRAIGKIRPVRRCGAGVIDIKHALEITGFESHPAPSHVYRETCEEEGILLGGIYLPCARGPETDDRGRLVVVACPLTFMRGLGPQRSVHNGREQRSFVRKAEGDGISYM